jgi:NAD+ diphosphatase
MVGFTARAVSTGLRLQEDEIEAARWFTRDELRRALDDGSLRISSRISIARRLIEHWYGEEIDVAEATLRA